jgi:GDPmannose 4,6-dehydratase
MFGDTPAPQDENSKMNPRSPYAAAKLHSHNLVGMYRDAYSIFAVSGILFNHESPRRQESFVTRKISKTAAEISLGLKTKIILGNLDARRDWGYAPEYVDAMWRMLQQDSPENFVISTGESFSVKDFLDLSFSHLNLDWKKYVEYDQIYERPLEVPHLLGNPSKALAKLGWEAKTRTPKLAQIMVDADLQELSKCI